MLAAGRTVIQLLGSESLLGMGRRLQRSNELGGSDSDGGGGDGLGV